MPDLELFYISIEEPGKPTDLLSPIGVTGKEVARKVAEETWEDRKRTGRETTTIALIDRYQHVSDVLDGSGWASEANDYGD